MGNSYQVDQRIVGMWRYHKSDVPLNSKAILIRPWRPALMWYVGGSFILKNLEWESSWNNEYDYIVVLVPGKKGFPLAKGWFHIRSQLNPGVDASPIAAQWSIADEFPCTQSCAEHDKCNHPILVPVRNGRARGNKIVRLTKNLMSKQVWKRIYHSGHLDKFSQFENISMVRLVGSCQGSALKKYYER